MRNWKTSLIGLFGVVYLFSGLILVYFKFVTLSEFAGSLALVSVFMTSILGFFSKDSDVTGGKRKQ
jgi:hypothetical protein